MESFPPFSFSDPKYDVINDAIMLFKHNLFREDIDNEKDNCLCHKDLGGAALKKAEAIAQKCDPKAEIDHDMLKAGEDGKPQFHANSWVVRVEDADPNQKIQEGVLTWNQVYDCWLQQICPENAKPQENPGLNLIRPDVNSIACGAAMTTCADEKGDFKTAAFVCLYDFTESKTCHKDKVTNDRSPTIEFEKDETIEAYFKKAKESVKIKDFCANSTCPYDML